MGWNARNVQLESKHRFLKLEEILHTRCRMRKNILFAVVCLILVANVGTQAQPPDISRWTGGTAIAPVQGYNMGDPLRLTWGFAAPNTLINDAAFSGYANAPNNLQTRLDQIYGSQAVWQPLFQSTFNRWSAISGLSFDYEPNDDGISYVVNTNQAPLGLVGTRADIRIGGKALDGNGGTLAYNYFPSVGDMVIDTNDNFYDNTTSDSQVLRFILAHELGHALGMEHVTSADQSFLLEPTYQSSFDGPAYHDILVAQRGYGDALEKTNGGLGNDSVSNATSLGTLVFNSNASIGNDARNLLVSANATDFLSIDSDTDRDYFSFNIESAGLLNVSLEALGFTYLAGPQGGSESLFDTRVRSDLRFSLFGTDGLTLLADVNSFGLGLAETLTGFNLGSAGTYFLRVQGSSNPDVTQLDTQFYGLNVGFITAVPEPSSMVLLGVFASAGALRVSMRRRNNRNSLQKSVTESIVS